MFPRHRRAMITGMFRIIGGVNLIAAAGLGAVTGVVLAATGLAFDRSSPSRPADAVPFYSCPGGAILGDVHRNDRIHATGKDGSEDWVEIRSPRSLDDRVWVQARSVVPDRAFEQLPEADCIESFALAPGEIPDPSPPPAEELTATPTSSPAPATPVPPITPSPVVPTDPRISGLRADPDAIWENHDACDEPTTSRVSVRVSDDSGPGSVVLRWSVAGRTGSSAMRQERDDRWSGTLGPFDSGTISGNQRSAPITVTVEATNDAGRTASDQTVVTLFRCPPIPG